MFALDLAARDMCQLSNAVGCGAAALAAGRCGFPTNSLKNAVLLNTGETLHVALLLSQDGGSETRGYTKLQV